MSGGRITSIFYLENIFILNNHLEYYGICFFNIAQNY